MGAHPLHIRLSGGGLALGASATRSPAGGDKAGPGVLAACPGPPHPTEALCWIPTHTPPCRGLSLYSGLAGCRAWAVRSRLPPPCQPQASSGRPEHCLPPLSPLGLCASYLQCPQPQRPLGPCPTAFSQLQDGRGRSAIHSPKSGPNPVQEYPGSRPQGGSARPLVSVFLLP